MFHDFDLPSANRKRWYRKYRSMLCDGVPCTSVPKFRSSRRMQPGLRGINRDNIICVFEASVSLASSEFQRPVCSFKFGAHLLCETSFQKCQHRTDTQNPSLTILSRSSRFRMKKHDRHFATTGTKDRI